MNILLTSVGRRTYLIDYFKNSLNGNGTVHASNSVYTYSMSHADKWVITPNIYDDGYIDFLLTYCKGNHINAIISLFDIDLPILAANKKIFQENGITIIVSEPNTINICNDKWATYKFLIEQDIKTPKSYISIDSLKIALRNNEIDFPIIMKPRWGMGSIGIYTIENMDELEILYLKLQRDIFKTYLCYESNIDRNNCIIFQEKIIGQEYGLDVFNDLNGNYVTTIAKKKLAMRAGETDVAEIIDSTPFVGIGKKLSQTMKHIANLDVDCFTDQDGKIFVLELNCRFGGQYPFSHLAGVDFPTQIVMWLNGFNTITENITPQIGTISCKDLHPVVINQY